MCACLCVRVHFIIYTCDNEDGIKYNTSIPKSVHSKTKNLEFIASAKTSGRDEANKWTADEVKKGLKKCQATVYMLLVITDSLKADNARWSKLLLEF